MAFKLTNSPFLSIEECVDVESGPGKPRRRKCKGRSAYKANRGDRSFVTFDKKMKKKRREARKRGSVASWQSRL